MAIASMALGLIAVLACGIPRLGAIMCLVGLVLAIKGYASSMRPFAIAGIVICIVGLVLANIMAVATGQIQYSPGGA